MQEAELDRLVNEAASKMIAAAMKERAGMPEGRSILHDVCSNCNTRVCCLPVAVLFCSSHEHVFTMVQTHGDSADPMEASHS